jgi:hypothetical protein
MDKPLLSLSVVMRASAGVSINVAERYDGKLPSLGSVMLDGLRLMSVAS